MLDSTIAAVDCDADPYSPQPLKVDAELAGVEATLGGMPPRGPSEIAHDGAVTGNSAGGKPPLGAGVVVESSS